MATWNQSINSGGLLAGIGKTNDNAPRASDINATLGMIRDNNELQRSGANNLGLQALSGLRGLADIYQADQQQQRQKEFFQKYGEARASGDVPKMRSLFAEFPEMNEQIGKGMEGISADTRESLGNVAANFRMAVNAGTGDQFVAKNAAELMRLGIDPKEAQRLAKADPKGAVELADTIGMSALTPEKYFDAVDAMTGRQIDREKLAETVRSNQAGEALTREGHQVQMRGQSLGYQSAALDRAQRSQMHSDNMGLKLMELTQKQQESGKIDPKLVQSINKDIDGFSKNYNAMYSASKSLESLGKRNTPAAQLGMIFNYMKSLDPQSVVREGEQVQVKRTDGIFGTMGNYVTQLSNGKMLNDDQVSDLINTSKVMTNTEGEKFNQQVDDYFSTYGDSLPDPLKNRFGSRKAKLFDDIQAPIGQKEQASSQLSQDDEALLNKYIQR